MAQYGTTITDIDIPFSRMVSIILKWMLASIPAIIVLWFVMALIMVAIAYLRGGDIPQLIQQLSRPPA